MPEGIHLAARAVIKQQKINLESVELDGDKIFEGQWKCSTPQYSSVQYSTLQYRAMQCSTEQCRTVYYSTMQYRVG